MFSDSCQALSASGLKGGRSYEVAIVVFPVHKEDYKVAMSNILVSYLTANTFPYLTVLGQITSIYRHTTGVDSETVNILSLIHI